ncbi:MAG: thioredoxin family protein, partial [Planctomycetota bacterium]
MRTGGTIAILALLLAAQGQDWVDSMEEARIEALKQKKPILLLVLEAGNKDSERVERDFDNHKRIKKLLDQFVCAKVDAAAHSGLKEKYDIKFWPAVLFFRTSGMPVKIIVGRVTGAKYASQMQEVLDKIRTPVRKKPAAAPKGSKPPEKPEKAIAHARTCPAGCDTCASAVKRALDWLARKQQKDGNWRKLKSETAKKTEDGKEKTRSIDHIDTTLTALTGLALMARGDAPDKAPLSRAVKFLRNSIRDDGIICKKKGHDWLYLVTSNFETALGAMFLAEVLKAKPDPGLKEDLGRVAAYLAKVQHPDTGGWGYSYDFREYDPRTQRGWCLVATTHCCVTALNYMKEAGVAVDQKAIERGVKYLLSHRTRDGSFAYGAVFTKERGYAAATGGSLFAIGRAGGQDLEKSWGYYRKRYRELEYQGRHWWFVLLFTALAMNDRSAGAWAEFDARFRDVLLHNQKDEGYWVEPDGTGGNVFSTAIAAIALQLQDGRLPITARRRKAGWDRAPVVEAVADPKYLKTPAGSSRVKVFERKGRYLVDLIVSVSVECDDAYFAQLREAVEGANRILCDVTDGQMSLHRVELVSGGKKWAEADVMITKMFYKEHTLPSKSASGYTLRSREIKKTVGGESEGRTIGMWVKLPYFARDTENVLPWDRPDLTRVMAHELCHYLFGVADEYDVNTGETYCECIMGRKRASELCRRSGHSDDRQKKDCWTHAKGLYSRLKVPRVADPGP